MIDGVHLPIHIHIHSTDGVERDARTCTTCPPSTRSSFFFGIYRLADKTQWITIRGESIPGWGHTPDKLTLKGAKVVEARVDC